MGCRVRARPILCHVQEHGDQAIWKLVNDDGTLKEGPKEGMEQRTSICLMREDSMLIMESCLTVGVLHLVGIEEMVTAFTWF